jgi:hypothetical protein
MTSDRPVLVHYHIFKNAGTSVRSILQASFGSAWSSFEGSHAHDTVRVDDLRRFLRGAPHIRAVSTHLARPPLPWPGCGAIVFIRHPIERVRSVFDFVHRDPSQPNADIARARGFSGYVRWALGGGRGGVVLRNYQVIHLSAATWRSGSILDAAATEADLREACRSIEGWGVHGIVDDFEASARLFQHTYGPLRPELRFEHVWHNRTGSGETTLEERLAHIRRDLGDELHAELVRHNELDLELYLFANTKFVELCAHHGIPSRTPRDGVL